MTFLKPAPFPQFPLLTFLLLSSCIFYNARSQAISCPTSQGALLLKDGGCVCPPGQYISADSSCTTFQPHDSSGNAVSEFSTYEIKPYVDLRVFTDSSNVQSTFFAVVVVLCVIWLIFALVVRLIPLGDGNSPGGGFVFKLRSAITRLDRRYHRKHWLDEQKVLVKRRTELGACCSVASYIVWVGMFLAFTFQFILSNNSTLQSLIPTNGQEVREFKNDLAWMITMVGNMDCDQVRLGNTNVDGTGLMQRVFNSTVVGVYSCIPSELGPTIIFSCPSCEPVSDSYFVTWEFFDKPGKPATAVGVNFEATSHISNNSYSYGSSVRGSIKAGYNGTNNPLATLRGSNNNVIQFQLIPRIFKDRKNLKLMQAVYHHFISGSSVDNVQELQASLANSTNTLSITIWVQILNKYIVEVDFVNNLSFLSYLARLGGVYGLAHSLFYLMQLQVEIRLRFMAYDDKLNAMAIRVRDRRYNWKKIQAATRLAWVMRHLKMLKMREEQELRELQEARQKRRADKITARRERQRRWQGWAFGASLKADGKSGFPRTDSASVALMALGDSPAGNAKLTAGSMVSRADSLRHSEPSVTGPAASTQSDAEGKKHDTNPTVLPFLPYSQAEDDGLEELLSIPRREEPSQVATEQGGAAAPISRLPPSFAMGPSTPTADDAPPDGSQTGPGQAQESAALFEGFGGGHKAPKIMSGPHPHLTSMMSTPQDNTVRRRGDLRRATSERAKGGFDALAGGIQTGIGIVTFPARKIGTVLPIWPHVDVDQKGQHPQTRYSSPFPMGRPRGLDEEEIQDERVLEEEALKKIDEEVLREEQEATAKELKKKKRKSKADVKASATYGSNTTYQGMTVLHLRQPSWLLGGETLPAVPALPQEGDDGDDNSDDEVDLVDLYNYLVDLYQYNMRLRQDFLAFQTMIENTVQYFRPASDL